MPLSQEAINSFIDLLKTELPEDLGIKDYVDAEQNLTSIPNYPIIFVLCPTFDVLQWYPPPEAILDIAYNLTIGCMILEQDASLLRTKLNTVVEQVIFALLRSQQEASSFRYTMNHNTEFKANFSPIISNGGKLIADAQVTFIARRNKVEDI